METRNSKVLDTEEYVSVLKEVIESGKETGIRIAGNSMSPFLAHERDYVYLKKPDRELKKGDIVFFQRRNGQYILHRICRCTPEGFYIVGDAQMEIEGPVERGQIFAIVTKACRKGKWIQKGDFWWDFFERVWINMIPLRRVVRSMYSHTFGRMGDSDEGKQK